MADYRSLCKSCGEEVVFGSHAENCPAQKAQRRAKKEAEDFAKEMREDYRNRSNDELMSDAAALLAEIRHIEFAKTAAMRRWEFLREILLDKRLIDDVRNRTGNRYL